MCSPSNGVIMRNKWPFTNTKWQEVWYNAGLDNLMTSQTEQQQHKKPGNGFRIEHQKIHPRTDWANRILNTCEQQTSDL